MDLKDFCFPVAERRVSEDDFTSAFVDWSNDPQNKKYYGHIL